MVTLLSDFSLSFIRIVQKCQFLNVGPFCDQITTAFILIAYRIFTFLMVDLKFISSIYTMQQQAIFQGGPLSTRNNVVRQENPKIVISSVIAQAVNAPRFLAMTTVLNLEHSEGFHDLFRLANWPPTAAFARPSGMEMALIMKF